MFLDNPVINTIRYQELFVATIEKYVPLNLSNVERIYIIVAGSFILCLVVNPLPSVLFQFFLHAKTH